MSLTLKSFTLQVVTANVRNSSMPYWFWKITTRFLWNSTSRVAGFMQIFLFRIFFFWHASYMTAKCFRSILADGTGSVTKIIITFPDDARLENTCQKNCKRWRMIRKYAQNLLSHVKRSEKSVQELWLPKSPTFSSVRINRYQFAGPHQQSHPAKA